MRITGGRLKGLVLASPRGRGTRPMTEKVRKALFDSLGERVLGARVLDLFSGSGALGIEALSRGAREVIFAEADPRVCEIIRQNLRKAGLENRARVVRAHLPRDLRRLPPGPYDLVFVTPPYGRGLGELTLENLPRDLLAEEGLIVVEESKRHPLAPGKGAFREYRRKVYGQTVLYFYGP